MTYTYCPPASGNALQRGRRRPDHAARLRPGRQRRSRRAGSTTSSTARSSSSTAATAPARRPTGQAALRGFFDSFPTSPVCKHPAGHQSGPVIARFDDMASPYRGARLGPGPAARRRSTRRRSSTSTRPWGERTNPEPLCARARARARAPAGDSAGAEHARARPTAPSAAPAPSASRRAERAPSRQPPRPAPADGRPAMRLYAFRDEDDGRARGRPGSTETGRPARDGVRGPDRRRLARRPRDVRRRAAHSRARRIPLDDVELRAPLPSPGKIVCVGLNYRDHVAEGGRPRPTGRSCSRSSPTPSSATASRSSGRRAPTPSTSRSSSASSSAGARIASRASDAMDHVAGYVVVNDVSARDWQGIPAGARARARRATASGCGPRAPTRSCRWVRSS